MFNREYSVQRFGRFCLSFFPDYSTVTQKIKETYTWLESFQSYRWLESSYEYSPINFSSITGLHHPSVAHLAGNPFLGRLSYYLREDGLGLAQEAGHLAELASKDPKGRAYCSVLAKPILLITRPEDIVQLLLYNEQKIDRGLATFNKIFGEHNLVSISSNSDEGYAEWKAKRSDLTKWILKPEALTELAPRMQEIIDEQFDKLMEKNNGQAPSLEAFFVALTMEVFARTRLGSDPLHEHVDILADNLDKAFSSSAMPNNNALARLAKTKLGAMFAYCRHRLDASLEKQHETLHGILTEEFLKPNLENIKATNNLLKHYFVNKEGSYVDTDTALVNAAEDAGVLLLAGHETTARLLQFTLILLAKHPDILAELREEIDKHRPSDGKWTRKSIKELTFLTYVIKETLRLYPSAPLLPREIREDLILADIPMCHNEADYLKAMENRDTTKDIVLTKGSRILISPWYTHRLESLFKNPEEFNPHRHTSTSIDYGADNVSWIPFGLGSRSCPGRHFAVQEAMITLAELVTNFNFNVTPANEDVHLLETYVVANVKHKGQVQVHFTPRHKDENEHRCEVGM
jgi:cytochrome P450